MCKRIGCDFGLVEKHTSGFYFSPPLSFLGGIQKDVFKWREEMPKIDGSKMDASLLIFL